MAHGELSLFRRDWRRTINGAFLIGSSLAMLAFAPPGFAVNGGYFDGGYHYGVSDAATKTSSGTSSGTLTSHISGIYLGGAAMPESNESGLVIDGSILFWNDNDNEKSKSKNREVVGDFMYSFGTLAAGIGLYNEHNSISSGYTLDNTAYALSLAYVKGGRKDEDAHFHSKFLAVLRYGPGTMTAHSEGKGFLTVDQSGGNYTNFEVKWIVRESTGVGLSIGLFGEGHSIKYSKVDGSEHTGSQAGIRVGMAF